MSIDRRSFLQVSAMVGGGLALGLVPGCAAPQKVRMRDLAQRDGTFAPNFFLAITPDNRLVVHHNKQEMGQGVMTAGATLVAEELDMPLDQVEVVMVSRPEFETSLGEVNLSGLAGELVGFQVTGGSSSTPETFIPMREAGASAREMLISAAAARWGVPRDVCRAENGAVVHADGKSLSYGELTTEAAQLPIAQEPPLKPRSKWRYIGKEGYTRPDAHDKVTGKARFGLDISIPGMVRAVVVRPPSLGQRVASSNIDSVRTAPGVVDIFEFERGVAVVAEKFWQAKAAAAKVQVTWEEGPLSNFNSADLAQDARARIEARPDSELRIRNDGNVDDVFNDGSMQVVDAIYEVPYLAHAAMEPLNCTIHIKDDEVYVWVPNQSPSVFAEAVARTLGVPQKRVRIETALMGGAFGRRGIPDVAVEAAMIAKRVDRPLQLVWTRECDFKGGYYRPIALARMRGAIDANNRVRALSCAGVSQSLMQDMNAFFGGTMPDVMPRLMKRMMLRANLGLVRAGSLPDIISGEGMSDCHYAIDNLRVTNTSVSVDLPVCFWRSVGHSYNAFFLEGFMNELATAAGKDPIEFRRELLREHPRHLGVLDAVAKASRWGAADLEPGWGRGVAVHKSFHTYAAQVVEAGVFDGRIKVRKVWCAVDCGIAVNPAIVRAQMESGIIFGLSAALDQRIDIVNGEVQQQNYDTFGALRMFESPEIEVEIIESNEDPMGVGEPGVPPVAPAVAAAIFDATGVRLRKMPMQQSWDEQRGRP